VNGCEVRIENVTRAFHGVAALRDVNLVCPPGRVTALLGASGSGKSTLLRIVAGLEPVNEGKVLLAGRQVSAPGATTPAEERGIGFVFQDYALFPHLSVRENVAFGLAKLPREARRPAALAWLERVGLAHRADAYPHELSGGEQQRVALARALAPQPRAILLDEPFSGLDPALRTDLRDRTLAAIAELGATALFVTHDADEALYIADQIAILRNGSLLQAGAPREVYAAPRSYEAAAALGPVNRFEGVVSGGRLHTPFGVLDASRADGPAVAVVRAESLALSPGSRVRVLERRPQGALDLVRLEADGVIWRALVPANAPTGETADVAIVAGFVF
jgi:iron(III) transport system ATP-binding protein